MWRGDQVVFDGVQKVSYTGSIKGGAILFRFASLSHWDKNFLLSGEGAANGSNDGRFHRRYQRASYCANNAVICLAERLFHLQNELMVTIAKGGPFQSVLAACEYRGRLVIFSVKEIPDLVYVDSEGVRVDYDGRLSGTTLVCPVKTYSVLNDVSEKIRGDRKRGLIYPSARHSRDVAIVLFGDETKSVLPSPYIALDVTLRLVSEEQDCLAKVPSLNPYKEKVHGGVGFFEFSSGKDLGDACAAGLLYPQLPQWGYIDLLRRRYIKYPDDAMVKLL